MTNDIDWEAEMEALDASLPRRLERAAQMAERSDMWTDTERLMPATGMADLIWEAHSEILEWRALNEERKASRTCPLGEDCDLTVAWMVGRESAKDEAQAMVAAALEEAAGAVAELVEGLRGLERTMQELLDACGRAGAFDNVVAQFFPDKETRGTRAENGYKRIDRARNEAKAQADFARALITKHEEPK